MKKWLPYFILLIVFIFFASGDVFAQCSQCKLLAGHENSIDDEVLDHGSRNNINTAILYIMMAPYILMGIAAIIMRKRIKRVFARFLAK